MPNWTSSQSDAIDSRNSNILVSAAAGSGKTAVLVERVIKIITDEDNPVDVDKLLVVTFTNAAAAEMKSRIMKRLNEKLADNPNDTVSARQLSLLPNAKICTIDSFCINLVRENFFNLDIEQNFRILDNSEAQIIEQNAIDSIVDDLYTEDKESFKSLVEMLSTTKSDEGFSNAVKRLCDYTTVQAFPEDWLNNVLEYYNPNVSIDNTLWKKYIFDDIRCNLEFIDTLIDDTFLLLSTDDPLYDKLYNLLNCDKACIEELKSALNLPWDECKAVFEKLKYVTMPRDPKKESLCKELIQELRDDYKKKVKELVTSRLTMSSVEYKNDCEILYPNLTKLVEIVNLYRQKVLDIKKEKNAYCFYDIEHFAINLLFYKENNAIVKTQLAKEYENNFYEILVDEYQDTNNAQDTLFEMLSNGRNRFMVGDVKQSIYRFRNAMPQIFNQKKNTYPLYSKNSNNPSQKIILDKNFRSRKGICEYTNFVFSILMNERIGELDYTQEEYLNFGAENYFDTDVPSAQIKLVEYPEDEDRDEFEAHQIAKYILNKVNSGEMVKGDDDKPRQINFGDFAVLFRTTKDRMPVYAKVLSQYSIPVVSDNKINLFDNNEISILLSLLRVVDNPMQDIPLLSVLMSSFYGYSADDLALARVNHKSGSLYSAVTANGDMFSAFINDLEKYRKYAVSMSVADFIRQIINDTSYLSVISAMGNGEQRRLNVLKLFDLAKGFDKTDNIGLTSFIRYIDRIIETSSTVESAEVSHSSNNSVMLMSIHRSKGLEFPVCILAGAGHKYNQTDMSALVQLHPENGIGLKVHQEEGLYRYPSLQYECIRDMNKSASMSENLRVLYVAITRAKEQFVTFITDKSIADLCKSVGKNIYNSSINPALSKKIKGDGDFLLACALLHKNGIFLRRYVDKVINPIDSDFDLDIEFINGAVEEVEQIEVTDVPFNENVVKQIDDKLSFVYKRSELSGFSSKRTASSLDEKQREYKYFASAKPAFLNKEGMTSAEKGTAMHTFMQFCDYNNAKNNLENEIARLRDSNYITKKQADSLNRQKLSDLFNSDFAKRMFNSDKIYREIKVSSFVPVSNLENTDYDDSVLIQGIADCVFEENGELVLVDYKTDKVDNDKELLDRYKNQIEFYRLAVSKTLKKDVKEAFLYSFSLGKACCYK